MFQCEVCGDVYLTSLVCRAIAMFALAIVIALSNYYITGRKIYAGPVVTIIKDA